MKTTPTSGDLAVNLPDKELLRLWRSVSGQHGELTGPLIRYAGLVYAAARSLAAAPVPCAASPADTLPYERINDKAMMNAMRLSDGEHLLVLQPYGWHLDARHIPNAVEHFSREGVCEDHGWSVVCDYGPYVAIVRATGEGARDAVTGLPAVPVPPVAAVEELAAVAEANDPRTEAVKWLLDIDDTLSQMERHGALCGSESRALRSARFLLARLRGEATVRVEG